MMMKRSILIALVSFAALLSAGASARLQTRQELRDEFNQTYPLAADGRVSLKNINGAVTVRVWDRSEVQVAAVRRAYTQERLTEAEIVVDATPEAIRIQTRYPTQNLNFYSDEPQRYNNPAAVDYTLTVPRGARLENIELINGALDIEGAAGAVKASSINGGVRARGLTGEVKLSTINGGLEATFAQLNPAQPISLSSVNGSVTLILASDASAQVKASTVHGGITNDWNLPVSRGRYVGRSMEGQLGSGGPRIRLNNVNGTIALRRAQDGRALSPATNLLREASGEDNGEAVDMQDAQREVARAQREAQREMDRAQREIGRLNRETHSQTQRERERAIREQQLEMARMQREIARETERIHRETARIAEEAARAGSVAIRERTPRFVDRETRSFPVSGAPRVRVETFDGSISVRSWDRPEVTFHADKRADSQQALNAIRVRAEQRGAEVVIIAERDQAQASEGGVSASLVVHVPRQLTSLRAYSGDGRVSVEGVNGEIELRTADGAVTALNTRGRLRVNTNDGSIRITGFDGEAEARTGDGRISLEGRFTQLSARTGDGAITLALAEGANAIIETDAPTATSDGLAVAESGGETSRVRRWRVGSGGRLFNLATGHGRINIRRANGASTAATP